MFGVAAHDEPRLVVFDERVAVTVRLAPEVVKLGSDSLSRSPASNDSFSRSSLKPGNEKWSDLPVFYRCISTTAELQTDKCEGAANKRIEGSVNTGAPH